MIFSDVIASTAKFGLLENTGIFFLEWPKKFNILYSYEELQKLHRKFSYPSTEKLFNLLNLAKPLEVDGETTKILDEITYRCEACQKFSQPPVRFEVSTPTEGNIVFGNELYFDSIFHELKAVPREVDTTSKFSAKTFLDSHGMNFGQSAEGIWIVFVMTWCLVYIG